MKRYGRRGNLSIFMCMVMSAVILLFGTLLQAARLRAAENDLSRAMAAQISTAEASFNPICRQFGLFGFNAGSVDDTVFKTMLPAVIRDCKMTYICKLPVTDADVLDCQITRYMKGRLPAVYLELLMNRLSGCRQSFTTYDSAALPVQTTASAGQSAQITPASETGTVNSLQAIVDSAIGSLTASDIEKTADSLLGNSLKDLENQLLQKFQDNYRQFAAEHLGASSDGSVAVVLGQTPDFLNPTSLSAMAGQVDKLMNFETAPIYEKFCLVEYILGHFQPSVQKMTTASGTTDLITLDGRKFSGFSKNRQNEVEQILTGMDNADQARVAVQAMLTGLRSLIRLVWILSDKQQMSDIQTAGTAISAAAVALSGGSVAIDPEIVTWLLVIGQALSGGFTDYSNLSAGNAVDIWPGRSEFNVSLYYQDYLRLFLLIVPRSTLLQRVGNQLDRILPEACFTQLEVSAVYRGKTYRMAGGYQ